ncbi:hypothetical protein J483_4290, partial [Acinetobacter baumannii 23037]
MSHFKFYSAMDPASFNLGSIAIYSVLSSFHRQYFIT